MDFGSMLAELIKISEEYKNRKPDDANAAIIYCAKFARCLQTLEEEDTEYEDKVTSLFMFLTQLSGNYPLLPDTAAKAELCQEIFVLCAKIVLNVKWQQLDEDSEAKKNFMVTLDVTHQQLSSQGFDKLGLVIQLTESHWTHPVLSSIMGGDDDIDEEEALKYIRAEDPVILRIRVEMLLTENCAEFASNLCNWASRHPVLKEDIDLRKLQLILLHKSNNVDKIQEQCQIMTCHLGVKLISYFEQREENQKLCVLLAQTFLIQDWIRESKRCCTKDLLKLWIRHQYLVDSEESKFIDSVWAVAKLSSCTEQIGILIEMLRKECGNRFLQLYIDLSVYAINLDKGSSEEASRNNEGEYVSQKKKDMSRTCERLTVLLWNVNAKVTKFSALTAYSLDPSMQRMEFAQAAFSKDIKEPPCLCQSSSKTESVLFSTPTPTVATVCTVCKLKTSVKSSDANLAKQVNMATLYEVERLLNMLRPNFLNPDADWSSLEPVSTLYLIMTTKPRFPSGLLNALISTSGQLNLSVYLQSANIFLNKSDLKLIGFIRRIICNPSISGNLKKTVIAVLKKHLVEQEGEAKLKQPQRAHDGSVPFSQVNINSGQGVSSSHFVGQASIHQPVTSVKNYFATQPTGTKPSTGVFPKHHPVSVTSTSTIRAPISSVNSLNLIGVPRLAFSNSPHTSSQPYRGVGKPSIPSSSNNTGQEWSVSTLPRSDATSCMKKATTPTSSSSSQYRFVPYLPSAMQTSMHNVKSSTASEKMKLLPDSKTSMAPKVPPASIPVKQRKKSQVKTEGVASLTQLREYLKGPSTNVAHMSRNLKCMPSNHPQVPIINNSSQSIPNLNLLQSQGNPLFSISTTAGAQLQPTSARPTSHKPQVVAQSSIKENVQQNASGTQAAAVTPTSNVSQSAVSGMPITYLSPNLVNIVPNDTSVGSMISRIRQELISSNQNQTSSSPVNVIQQGATVLIVSVPQSSNTSQPHGVTVTASNIQSVSHAFHPTLNDIPRSRLIVPQRKRNTKKSKSQLELEHERLVSMKLVESIKKAANQAIVCKASKSHSGSITSTSTVNYRTQMTNVSADKKLWSNASTTDTHHGELHNQNVNRLPSHSVYGHPNKTVEFSRSDASSQERSIFVNSASEKYVKQKSQTCTNEQVFKSDPSRASIVTDGNKNSVKQLISMGIDEVFNSKTKDVVALNLIKDRFSESTVTNDSLKQAEKRRVLAPSVQYDTNNAIASDAEKIHVSKSNSSFSNTPNPNNSISSEAGKAERHQIDFSDLQSDNPFDIDVTEMSRESPNHEMFDSENCSHLPQSKSVLESGNKKSVESKDDSKYPSSDSRTPLKPDEPQCPQLSLGEDFQNPTSPELSTQHLDEVSVVCKPKKQDEFSFNSSCLSQSTDESKADSDEIHLLQEVDNPVVNDTHKLVEKTDGDNSESLDNSSEVPVEKSDADNRNIFELIQSEQEKNVDVDTNAALPSSEDMKRMSAYRDNFQELTISADNVPSQKMDSDLCEMQTSSAEVSPLASTNSEQENRNIFHILEDEFSLKDSPCKCEIPNTDCEHISSGVTECVDKEKMSSEDDVIMSHPASDAAQTEILHKMIESLNEFCEKLEAGKFNNVSFPASQPDIRQENVKMSAETEVSCVNESDSSIDMIETSAGKLLSGDFDIQTEEVMIKDCLSRKYVTVYRCIICLELFETGKELKEHVTSGCKPSLGFVSYYHHLNLRKNVPGNISQEIVLLKCVECERLFKNKQSIANHFDEKYRMFAEKQMKEQVESGAGEISVKDSGGHKIQSNNQFQCKICGAAYLSSGPYKTHLGRYHGIENIDEYLKECSLRAIQVSIGSTQSRSSHKMAATMTPSQEDDQDLTSINESQFKRCEESTEKILLDVANAVHINCEQKSLTASDTDDNSTKDSGDSPSLNSDKEAIEQSKKKETLCKNKSSIGKADVKSEKIQKKTTESVKQVKINKKSFHGVKEKIQKAKTVMNKKMRNSLKQKEEKEKLEREEEKISEKSIGSDSDDASTVEPTSNADKGKNKVGEPKYIRCNTKDLLIAGSYFYCKRCQDRFNRTFTLLKHYMMKHLKYFEIGRIGRKGIIVKCLLCDKEFSSKTQFMNHVPHHYETVLRLSCGGNQSFTSKSTKSDNISRNYSVDYLPKKIQSSPNYIAKKLHRADFPGSSSLKVVSKMESQYKKRRSPRRSSRLREPGNIHFYGEAVKRLDYEETSDGEKSQTSQESPKESDGLELSESEDTFQEDSLSDSSTYDTCEIVHKANQNRFEKKNLNPTYSSNLDSVDDSSGESSGEKNIDLKEDKSSVQTGCVPVSRSDVNDGQQTVPSELFNNKDHSLSVTIGPRKRGRPRKIVRSRNAATKSSEFKNKTSSCKFKTIIHTNKVRNAPRITNEFRIKTDSECMKTIHTKIDTSKASAGGDKSLENHRKDSTSSNSDVHPVRKNSVITPTTHSDDSQQGTIQKSTNGREMSLNVLKTESHLQENKDSKLINTEEENVPCVINDDKNDIKHKINQKNIMKSRNSIGRKPTCLPDYSVEEMPTQEDENSKIIPQENMEKTTAVGSCVSEDTTEGNVSSVGFNIHDIKCKTEQRKSKTTAECLMKWKATCSSDSESSEPSKKDLLLKSQRKKGKYSSDSDWENPSDGDPTDSESEAEIHKTYRTRACVKPGELESEAQTTEKKPVEEEFVAPEIIEYSEESNCIISSADYDLSDMISSVVAENICEDIPASNTIFPDQNPILCNNFTTDNDGNNERKKRNEFTNSSLKIDDDNTGNVKLSGDDEARKSENEPSLSMSNVKDKECLHKQSVVIETVTDDIYIKQEPCSIETNDCLEKTYDKSQKQTDYCDQMDTNCDVSSTVYVKSTDVPSTCVKLNTSDDDHDQMDKKNQCSGQIKSAEKVFDSSSSNVNDTSCGIVNDECIQDEPCSAHLDSCAEEPCNKQEDSTVVNDDTEPKNDKVDTESRYLKDNCGDSEQSEQDFKSLHIDIPLKNPTNENLSMKTEIRHDENSSNSDVAEESNNELSIISSSPVNQDDEWSDSELVNTDEAVSDDASIVNPGSVKNDEKNVQTDSNAFNKAFIDFTKDSTNYVPVPNAINDQFSLDFTEDSEKSSAQIANDQFNKAFIDFALRDNGALGSKDKFTNKPQEKSDIGLATQSSELKKDECTAFDTQEIENITATVKHDFKSDYGGQQKEKAKEFIGKRSIENKNDDQKKCSSVQDLSTDLGVPAERTVSWCYKNPNYLDAFKNFLVVDTGPTGKQSAETRSCKSVEMHGKTQQRKLNIINENVNSGRNSSKLTATTEQNMKDTTGCESVTSCVKDASKLKEDCLSKKKLCRVVVEKLPDKLSSSYVKGIKSTNDDTFCKNLILEESHQSNNKGDSNVLAGSDNLSAQINTISTSFSECDHNVCLETSHQHGGDRISDEAGNKYSEADVGNECSGSSNIKQQIDQNMEDEPTSGYRISPCDHNLKEKEGLNICSHAKNVLTADAKSVTDIGQDEHISTKRFLSTAQDSDSEKSFNDNVSCTIETKNNFITKKSPSPAGKPSSSMSAIHNCDEKNVSSSLRYPRNEHLQVNIAKETDFVSNKLTCELDEVPQTSKDLCELSQDDRSLSSIDKMLNKSPIQSINYPEECGIHQCVSNSNTVGDHKENEALLSECHTLSDCVEELSEQQKCDYVHSQTEVIAIEAARSCSTPLKQDSLYKQEADMTDISTFSDTEQKNSAFSQLELEAKSLFESSVIIRKEAVSDEAVACACKDKTLNRKSANDNILTEKKTDSYNYEATSTSEQGELHKDVIQSITERLSDSERLSYSAKHDQNQEFSYCSVERKDNFSRNIPSMDTDHQTAGQTVVQTEKLHLESDKVEKPQKNSVTSGKNVESLLGIICEADKQEHYTFEKRKRSQTSSVNCLENIKRRRLDPGSRNSVKDNLKNKAKKYIQRSSKIMLLKKRGSLVKGSPVKAERSLQLRTRTVSLNKQLDESKQNSSNQSGNHLNLDSKTCANNFETGKRNVDENYSLKKSDEELDSSEFRDNNSSRLSVHGEKSFKQNSNISADEVTQVVNQNSTKSAISSNAEITQSTNIVTRSLTKKKSDDNKTFVSRKVKSRNSKTRAMSLVHSWIFSDRKSQFLSEQDDAKSQKGNSRILQKRPLTQLGILRKCKSKKSSHACSELQINDKLKSTVDKLRSRGKCNSVSEVDCKHKYCNIGCKLKPNVTIKKQLTDRTRDSMGRYRSTPDVFDMQPTPYSKIQTSVSLCGPNLHKPQDNVMQCSVNDVKKTAEFKSHVKTEDNATVISQRVKRRKLNLSADQQKQLNETQPLTSENVMMVNDLANSNSNSTSDIVESANSSRSNSIERKSRSRSASSILSQIDMGCKLKCEVGSYDKQTRNTRAVDKITRASSSDGFSLKNNKNPIFQGNKNGEQSTEEKRRVKTSFVTRKSNNFALNISLNSKLETSGLPEMKHRSKNGTHLKNNENIMKTRPCPKRNSKFAKNVTAERTSPNVLVDKHALKMKLTKWGLTKNRGKGRSKYCMKNKLRCKKKPFHSVCKVSKKGHSKHTKKINSDDAAIFELHDKPRTLRSFDSVQKDMQKKTKMCSLDTVQAKRDVKCVDMLSTKKIETASDSFDLKKVSLTDADEQHSEEVLPRSRKRICRSFECSKADGTFTKESKIENLNISSPEDKHRSLRSSVTNHGSSIVSKSNERKTSNQNVSSLSVHQESNVLDMSECRLSRSQSKEFNSSIAPEDEQKTSMSIDSSKTDRNQSKNTSSPVISHDCDNLKNPLELRHLRSGSNASSGSVNSSDQHHALRSSDCCKVRKTVSKDTKVGTLTPDANLTNLSNNINGKIDTCKAFTEDFTVTETIHLECKRQSLRSSAMNEPGQDILKNSEIEIQQSNAPSTSVNRKDHAKCAHKVHTDDPSDTLISNNNNSRTLHSHDTKKGAETRTLKTSSMSSTVACDTIKTGLSSGTRRSRSYSGNSYCAKNQSELNNRMRSSSGNKMNEDFRGYKDDIKNNTTQQSTPYHSKDKHRIVSDSKCDSHYEDSHVSTAFHSEGQARTLRSNDSRADKVAEEVTETDRVKSTHPSLVSEENKNIESVCEMRQSYLGDSVSDRNVSKKNRNLISCERDKIDKRSLIDNNNELAKSNASCSQGFPGTKNKDMSKSTRSRSCSGESNVSSVFHSEHERRSCRSSSTQVGKTTSKNMDMSKSTRSRSCSGESDVSSVFHSEHKRRSRRSSSTQVGKTASKDMCESTKELRSHSKVPNTAARSQSKSKRKSCQGHLGDSEIDTEKPHASADSNRANRTTIVGPKIETELNSSSLCEPEDICKVSHSVCSSGLASSAPSVPTMDSVEHKHRSLRSSDSSKAAKTLSKQSKIDKVETSCDTNKVVGTCKSTNQLCSGVSNVKRKLVSQKDRAVRKEARKRIRNETSKQNFTSLKASDIRKKENIHKSRKTRSCTGSLDSDKHSSNCQEKLISKPATKNFEASPNYSLVPCQSTTTRGRCKLGLSSTRSECLNIRSRQKTKNSLNSSAGDECKNAESHESECKCTDDDNSSDIVDNKSRTILPSDMDSFNANNVALKDTVKSSPGILKVIDDNNKTRAGQDVKRSKLFKRDPETTSNLEDKCANEVQINENEGKHSQRITKIVVDNEISEIEDHHSTSEDKKCIRIGSTAIPYVDEKCVFSSDMKACSTWGRSPSSSPPSGRKKDLTCQSQNKMLNSFSKEYDLSKLVTVSSTNSSLKNAHKRKQISSPTSKYEKKCTKKLFQSSFTKGVSKPLSQSVSSTDTSLSFATNNNAKESALTKLREKTCLEPFSWDVSSFKSETKSSALKKLRANTQIEPFKWDMGSESESIHFQSPSHHSKSRISSSHLISNGDSCFSDSESISSYTSNYSVDFDCGHDDNPSSDCSACRRKHLDRLYSSFIKAAKSESSDEPESDGATKTVNKSDIKSVNLGQPNLSDLTLSKDVSPKLSAESPKVLVRLKEVAAPDKKIIAAIQQMEGEKGEILDRTRNSKIKIFRVENVAGAVSKHKTGKTVLQASPIGSKSLSLPLKSPLSNASKNYLKWKMQKRQSSESAFPLMVKKSPH